MKTNLIILIITLITLKSFSQDTFKGNSNEIVDIVCNNSSSIKYDSLIANPHLLTRMYTFYSHDDSIKTIHFIDSSNVLKQFRLKDQQMKQFRTLNSKLHLPPYSRIIEVKDLKESGIDNRAIIYWIQNPKVNLYCDIDYDCYSSMMGHGQFYGDLKFSVININEYKIINTIDIVYDKSTFDTSEYINSCSFLPFSSPTECSHMALNSRIFYTVMGGDSLEEGLTNILHLEDYNGDENALEFALYVPGDGGCMGTESSLIGYDKETDSILQFPIEITRTSLNPKGKDIVEKYVSHWLGYTFTMPFKDKKSQYSIDYRGRGGCLSKISVIFDDKRKCFIAEVDDRITEYKKHEKASWISYPESK